MADFTFGQMVENAKTAESAGSDVEVTPGAYEASIVVTNSKLNANGKLVIGFKFKIESEGPCKGGGVWGNQYLSPESPAALDIWFATFEALGVPRSHWSQFGADLSAAGADVATRIKGARAKITVEIDGQYGAKVKRVSRPTGTAPAAAGVGAGGSTPPASRPNTPF